MITRVVIASLLLAMAGPSLAAKIDVTNGDTFKRDFAIYRLDERGHACP